MLFLTFPWPSGVVMIHQTFATKIDPKVQKEEGDFPNLPNVVYFFEM
jgi:hypothetical protein